VFIFPSAPLGYRRPIKETQLAGVFKILGGGLAKRATSFVPETAALEGDMIWEGKYLGNISILVE
jgi:hypothetical protein